MPAARGWETPAGDDVCLVGFAGCAAGASVSHANRASVVKRVVVVASSEVPQELLDELVGPDDELHVVVPAVEQSRLQWLANDEDDARADAESVGEEIGRAAQAEPSSVTVKQADPSQLVVDAVAEHKPDFIILALRQGEEATWLEKGELSAAPSQIEGVPLVRVRI